MNATQCVDFLNRIPGFYASSPTAGHVQIHSAYWVGFVTYYPGKGNYDINNVSSQDSVSEALRAISVDSRPLSLIVLVKAVFSTDQLVVMLSNMCNALRACE